MKKNIFTESTRLAKRFPKKVITHAVKDKKTFLRILHESKIKIPSEGKNSKKMTPYMERILGINNCVYLGLGFVYNASHHNWPYAFIFNKNILKNKHITTYSAFLISQAWLRFLRKAKQEDPELLKKIRNANKRTKHEIDGFFKTNSCNWFHIEKELQDIFKNYENKEKYIGFIKEFQIKHIIKNSYAPRYLATGYHLNPNFKKFEAISKKSIKLSDKNFIGVYIKESDKKTIERVKKLLGKEKIVYTGKRIIKI